MDIREKTVVLTGATGGIGKAIAERLHADGARLILVARNPARLAALAAALGDERHSIVAADLGTEPGRQRVADTCRAAKGGVSLLINNAGVNAFALLEQLAADDIRRLIDTNLVSPILMCRTLLPLLRQQDQSGIVNIGSTFGSIGYPGFSAYSASKFGLRGFTEALRRELAGTSTRVDYIAPRATRTELNSADVVAMNDALGTAMDDPALVADEVSRIIGRPAGSNTYIGWPEKLFVRINALFPGLVDNSLRKKLPVIRRFASQRT